MKVHNALPHAKFHETVMYSLRAMMSNGLTDRQTDGLTDGGDSNIPLRKPKWNNNCVLCKDNINHKLHGHHFFH